MIKELDFRVINKSTENLIFSTLLLGSKKTECISAGCWVSFLQLQPAEIKLNSRRNCVEVKKQFVSFVFHRIVFCNKI